jgi:hypothetical protein
VFGELDPTHRLNVGIVNLDRAARSARGNVEYQGDFRILNPIELARGNGCLVYDVPNRGNHCNDLHYQAGTQSRAVPMPVQPRRQKAKA